MQVLFDGTAPGFNLLQKPVQDLLLQSLLSLTAPKHIICVYLDNYPTNFFC